MRIRLEGSDTGEPIRREWRGFDTETENGRAVLLTTDRAFLAFPATFLECARWLVRQGDRFAAWNMDYDARAVLLFLPWKALSRLHYTTWTNHHGWKIHYLPRKVLELHEPKREGGRVVRIFDALQFFGGSLAKAAPRVGLEKLDCPKTWYPKMGWALRNHFNRVVRYGVQDALIVQRHAELLLPRLLEFAKCEAPYSPAAVARSYFGDRLQFKESRWQQDIFRKSYKGGRIEVFQRGRCGAGILYDIRSAYPDALSRALDPRHMMFARTGRYSADAGYGAYHVAVHVPTTMHVSPLAYKSYVNGQETTVYPTGDLEIVVDRETFRLLRNLGLGPKILDAWEYLIEKEVRLFHDIPELFARRKKEPDLDLAIKLTLNGLYGIMCQEVDTWIKPKYITEKSRRFGGEYRERFARLANTTHFAVGAFITGQTRRRVYELAAKDPSNVLFISTDGVSFRGAGPRGIPVGDGLGDWTVAERFEDSLVVGTGIYSLKVRGEWKDKTRGFRPDGVTLRETLDTPRKWASVPATQVDTLADGMKEAAAQINVVQRLRKRMDFNFDKKRVWDREFTGRELLRSRFVSRPWEIR